MNPTYSSAGLLYSLTRDNALSEILYFPFAGRPVAQLTIDGDNETYEWITTDHLGTPIALTNSTGALLWQGGFEPYGKDYAGAAAQNLFLRLPGQWEEETWSEAGLGVGAFYNVHRWYESGAGRYGEVDLLETDRASGVYTYAESNALRYLDQLGLIYTSEECGWCDSAAEQRELEGIRAFFQANGTRYRKDWLKLSYDCGAAADDAVSDVERVLAPKCWVTRTQQLASPGVAYLGAALNAVTYTFLGFNASVHWVPVFRPCSKAHGPGADLFADPSYGQDLLKPLPWTWRIEDLQDQPLGGPLCLWK
ncbi:MAG: RHS domain-containing protein [Thermoanaerobaculia bacterium]